MSEYAVVDPVSGETLREYPTIDDQALSAALSRAHETYMTWSQSTTVQERAALLRRAAELHDERAEELAQIVVREMGKPIGEALDEAGASMIYRFYADNAERIMADEPLDLPPGAGSAVVRRAPYGVLLGVMPWNYPYYQVMRFAAPNLLNGNPILLKHAPQCPESAEAIEQLLRDAGFPEGAFINIRATHEQIEKVIADPRVRGVSVTGSQRAGSAIAELAGRHLKKVVLELGGSDPFIVLPTNDLDRAVEIAVAARLDNTGQACNAAKRFIVLDELYEPFLSKFTSALSKIEVGDPQTHSLGPLSSTSAADRLEDQVQRAVDQGATLVLGGKRNGNYFDPTVLADIAPDNAACREEFFGPVAQVYRVASEDEAVKLANDTEFGLGSFIIADDADQAKRVADKIEAGMVFINMVGANGASLPFGGVKGSGFGRELGTPGADEFVNKKLIRTSA